MVCHTDRRRVDDAVRLCQHGGQVVQRTDRGAVGAEPDRERTGEPRRPVAVEVDDRQMTDAKG
jgi:hypothetical protein